MPKVCAALRTVQPVAAMYSPSCMVRVSVSFCLLMLHHLPCWYLLHVYDQGIEGIIIK